jgi:translocation and assembly module TamB
VADMQGQRLQATYAASRLPGDPQATLKVQLAGIQGPSFPKSSLQLDASYAAQRGTLAVAVTEGPYQRTQVNGKVVLTDGQRLTLDTLRVRYQDLMWENAAPVQVARSPQGALQIQSLHLRSGAQEIRVQGALTAQGAVQAQAQIRQLQVQPTVHVVAPDAAVPDGRLTLDLTVAGTLQQPQLQGQLQLTALQWQKQQLGDIRASIGLTGETLKTDLHWQDQGGELLQVQGTVGLTPTGALDLRLQTPGLNLDRLPPLGPAVTHSAGTIKLDLRLTGTRQQPQARGDLVVHNGALQLAATGERYKDIEANIVFSGERVSIEQLRVNSRSGPLQVTGQIAYAGQTVQQVNLSIQAQNFTPIHTAGIEAITSANVTVRGSLQDLEATGSITIPRAHVRLDSIPGSGPKPVQPWELTVAGVYGPGPGTVPRANGATPTKVGQEVPLPFLRANLQVDIPRNVWIQGPGTAIEMSGTLTITKARQEAFILSGPIETVRGYATYYGKKFTVEKGTVTFTGSQEINPLLDVTVTRTISDYVVSIHVGGKAQMPEITFSSIPELPQIDIISLLVLGKTTDRLTGGEQSSLSSTVQQISGGIIAGQLEKLGQSVGLDTIEVSAGDQLGTGTVKAGRYVTQDIFLSYERELGGDNANTVGVEYSLNRRLKLKGTGSDLGETALDLLWRLDY